MFEPAPSQVLDEVEIRIFPSYKSGYEAEMLTSDGGLASALLGDLPTGELNERCRNEIGYGLRLGEWLFQGAIGESLVVDPPRIEIRRSGRKKASFSATRREVRKGGLRLRLWLDPDSSELNGLWWEAIRHPTSSAPLATNLAFSRYLLVTQDQDLSVKDLFETPDQGLPVPDRPLRMLVIACNPSNLDQFGLKPINVSLQLSILGDSTRPMRWMLDIDTPLVGPVTTGQVQERLMGKGFDLRLMSWGDGSGVPTSGNNLVIVGIDSNGLLHIRIYEAVGNRITDKEETKLPAAQAAAIATLKQQLPGLLPPHVLTDAEKAQVIREATSIVGQKLGGYHIVHLLTYASWEKGESSLIFSSSDGKVIRTPGEEAARLLAGSTSPPPYLIFLATPLEYPQKEDEECPTPVAIAPMLVEAGAQAAVGMQAAISVERMRRFTERFYAVLIRTGLVDLAMAVARAEIYEEGSWEWTYPVLCMRNPDGQLFHRLPEALEAAISTISRLAHEFSLSSVEKT